MNDRDSLLEKIRKIEALHSGASTEGERVAADSAIKRIMAKIAGYEKTDPAVEFTFRLTNQWSNRLLIALLRRYGIQPYRYWRQRRTTVVAKVPKSFVNETLWPEFVELEKALQEHIGRVTDDIIRQAISDDESEVEEVAGAIAAGDRD